MDTLKTIEQLKKLQARKEILQNALKDMGRNLSLKITIDFELSNFYPNRYKGEEITIEEEYLKTALEQQLDFVSNQIKEKLEELNKEMGARIVFSNKEDE